MGEVVRFRPSQPREDAPALPPPHDLEAERATLSACLLDGSPHADGTPNACDIACEVFGDAGPAVFYDPSNARVWEAITEIRKSGAPVDLAMVNGPLRRFPAPSGCETWAVYLATLADASPELSNVEHHARIVLERHEDRELVAAGLRIAAQGRAIPGDRAAWRAGVRAEVGRLTAPRVKLSGAIMGTAVREARAHVQSVVDGRVVGVRWGIATIDELVGLLALGRQHILAGLSEHGKTALAFQVAVNVAELQDPCLTCGARRGEACTEVPGHVGPHVPGMREAVYVLSGEMSRKDFVFRGACSMAGVDARRVEAGHANPSELQKVSAWLDYLSTLPIVVDDVPATSSELAARVLARRADFAAGRARDDNGNLLPRCRMQTVVGDHLQRLAMLRTDIRDKFERIAATSNGWLTDIAKGCGVATLLLCQMNNNILSDVDKPRAKGRPRIRWPRANDLYGASEIKNDADTIIAVHRPDLVDPDGCPDEWRGLAGIVPLKRRFGGDGRVRALRHDKGLFTDDVTTPDDD